MDIKDTELISIIQKDEDISIIELKVHENGYVDLTYKFNYIPSDLEGAHLRKKRKIASIVKKETNENGYSVLRIYNNTIRNNRRQSRDSKEVNNNRLQREIDNSLNNYTVGYLPKIFIVCSLPRGKNFIDIIDKNKKIRHVEVFESETINGHYKLTVTSPVGIGLPYGPIPRMFFSWLCREVMIHKKRIVPLGSSFSGFIKELGYSVTGGKNGTIKRIKEQIIRLCSCHIQITHKDKGIYKSINMTISSNFFMTLKENQPAIFLDGDGQIELSEETFNALLHNNVPFDTNIMAKFMHSALAMDLYTWINHRQSYLKKPILVSWDLVQLQLGSTYKRKIDFIKEVRIQMKNVNKEFTSGAKCTKTGIYMIPTNTSIPKINSNEK